MTPEHCARTFDELWPGSDWTDTIGREFWRRVERFSLTDEQVIAVLKEHRMTTRYKSPVPADLLSKLRDVSIQSSGKQRPVSSSQTETRPDGLVVLARFMRDNADGIRALIENACTCPHMKSEIYPRHDHELGGARCNACGGAVAGKFWASFYDPKKRTERAAAKRSNDERNRRRVEAFSAILAGHEPREGRSELRHILAEHDRQIAAIEERLGA